MLLQGLPADDCREQLHVLLLRVRDLHLPRVHGAQARPAHPPGGYGRARARLPGLPGGHRHAAGGTVLGGALLRHAALARAGQRGK